MFGKIYFGILGAMWIAERVISPPANNNDIDQAWIGIALMVASTAISMYGQYQAGQQADAMGEYNAELALQQGKSKASAIKAEARHKRRLDRAEGASVRAGYGGSNIMSDTGSPLLIQAELAKENAYDQLEMQRQADIAVTHGAAQASMFEWEGEQAKKASLLSMAGTAMGAAGTMTSMYKSGQVADAKTEFYKANTPKG